LPQLLGDLISAALKAERIARSVFDHRLPTERVILAHADRQFTNADLRPDQFCEFPAGLSRLAHEKDPLALRDARSDAPIVENSQIKSGVLRGIGNFGIPAPLPHTVPGKPQRSTPCGDQSLTAGFQAAHADGAQLRCVLRRSVRAALA
jgi:hypothetical protein